MNKTAKVIENYENSKVVVLDNVKVSAFYQGALLEVAIDDDCFSIGCGTGIASAFKEILFTIKNPSLVGFNGVKLSIDVSGTIIVKKNKVAVKIYCDGEYTEILVNNELSGIICGKENMEKLTSCLEML